MFSLVASSKLSSFSFLVSFLKFGPEKLRKMSLYSGIISSDIKPLGRSTLSRTTANQNNLFPISACFQQRTVAYHRDQVETNIDESSRRYQGTIRGHVKNKKAQLFKYPKYIHMSNGFHKVFHCPNVHLVFDGVV